MKDENGDILDGHNRDRAWRELRAEGCQLADYPILLAPAGLTEAEKRSYIRSLNLDRRHLTLEQRRELIADQLRETPEQSDRQIGKALGVDHKTVAKGRNKLESTGEIPQMNRTIGQDGRTRRRARRPKNKTIVSIKTSPKTVKVVDTIPFNDQDQDTETTYYENLRRLASAMQDRVNDLVRLAGNTEVKKVIDVINRTELSLAIARAMFDGNG